jgi:uncharacterized protein YndB with AHSA1/START domain
MGTLHAAVDIGRPPAEVFAFVAEPRNMSLWYEAVDEVTKTTDTPSGSGARYRVTRSLPGGHAHNDVEITEHQLDQVVTIESRSGPTPFRYRYTLEPKGSATRLTLDGRISTAGHSGPMARLDGIATRLFERGMQQNLHQLKRILEGPSNTAHPRRGRRP